MLLRSRSGETQTGLAEADGKGLADQRAIQRSVFLDARWFCSNEDLQQITDSFARRWDTLARRASEGHKVNHSTRLRDVVVSLARASGYRCFDNYGDERTLEAGTSGRARCLAGTSWPRSSGGIANPVSILGAPRRARFLVHGSEM